MSFLNTQSFNNKFVCIFAYVWTRARLHRPIV